MTTSRRQNILITGATDGLGKGLAINLFKEGYNLILHGRNQQKLEDLKAELLTLITNSNIQEAQTVESFCADLSNLKETLNLSKQILEKVSKLDILINNAGIWGKELNPNNEINDQAFIVNYLSPYLLTNKLYDLLLQSSKDLQQTNSNHKSLIINISSAAQRNGTLKEFLTIKKLNEYQNYCKSKLAISIWSQAFSAEKTEVITINVNPGSRLKTKMVVQNYGDWDLPLSKGIDAISNLITSKIYLQHHGEYFDNDLGTNGSFASLNIDCYNLETQVLLEKVTEDLIQKLL